MNSFSQRKLVIATKHHKEKVIAPLIEKALGVECFVSKNFDTDTLGTFTGEVERKDNPIETVRKKCLTAMKLNNCDLGIASEGSFGAHPNMFFATANEEFLILIDQKNELEIIARIISSSTNFNGQAINSERELLAFAKKVKFPSHALILRPKKDENKNIFKGITHLKILKSIFRELKEKNSSVYVETDMRAMYNPTRMEVIKEATHKLIEKINSRCHQCHTPGFGIVDTILGLPCEYCEQATQSIQYYVYECQKCGFQYQQTNPNKTTEDPMYCNFCNP